jgi:hypothetical protein
LEEPRETTKNFSQNSGVPVEIRTEHLTNISLKLRSYTNLLGAYKLLYTFILIKNNFI